VNLSVGIDSVNVWRVENALKNSNRFLRIAFSEEESGFEFVQLAGNFAAKEALVKATKGIIKLYNFRDISVKRRENGSPLYILSNELKNLLGAEFKSELSMTYCCGCVTAITVVSFNQNERGES